MVSSFHFCSAALLRPVPGDRKDPKGGWSPSLENTHMAKLIFSCFHCIIEGSLEVKLPTIWTDKKQRWEEQEKRREEKRRRKKKEDQKEEVSDSEERGFRRATRSRFTVAPEGRKVGSLKRRVQSHVVGKLHAVVARSTFASEKAKNTSRSHISKSKCTKRLMFGPLLEVETSKKCTPL